LTSSLSSSSSVRVGSTTTSLRFVGGAGSPWVGASNRRETGIGS
jgi:hypothetical protein